MVRRRALLILGAAAAAGVALRLGLAQYVPVTCPLRGLTGIPCASCGLTRAAAALCRGQWTAASAHNVAAIPLALFGVAVLLLLAWEAITQRPVLRPLWARYSGLLTWAAVALMSAAWVVNLHRHFQ